MTALTTQCCIVGGGPAGMMLGFLLARTGVRSIVLEKHADFLRDFRGDTVHPSTLNVMDELGLLDEFLKLPHQEVARFGADESSGVTTAPCPTSSPTSRSESTVALSQPREMTPSFIRGSSRT